MGGVLLEPLPAGVHAAEAFDEELRRHFLEHEPADAETERGDKGFSGRHDLASLNAMKAGPWSLKERVSALAGSLVIDSNDAGARVEIAVPVTAGR